jgi:hypothetical protein
MDDLDNIALAERQRCVCIAVTEDRFVVFHDYKAGIDTKRAKKARDGAVTLQLP